MRFAFTLIPPCSLSGMRGELPPVPGSSGSDSSEVTKRSHVSVITRLARQYQYCQFTIISIRTHFGTREYICDLFRFGLESGEENVRSLGAR